MGDGTVAALLHLVRWDGIGGSSTVRGGVEFGKYSKQHCLSTIAYLSIRFWEGEKAIGGSHCVCTAGAVVVDLRFRGERGI